MRDRSHGDLCKCNIERCVDARDDHSPGTEITDASGDLSRIHTRNTGNALILHLFREGLRIAEVARHVIVITDDQASDARVLALVVVVRDAVVADQGVCHDHHLVGI